MAWQMASNLEEVPMACKNIRDVMAAQSDLVTVLGQFDPKLVKWRRPLSARRIENISRSVVAFEKVGADVRRL